MRNRLFTISIATFSILLVSLILFFYRSYQNERELNSIKIFFDYQTKQLHKNIEDQKLSSMALAVLLSQNDRVQECFLNQNRPLCISNIDDIVKNLKSVLMYKNIKIHMHTNDLKSYLRSWATYKYGDNLSSFRHLLLEAKKSKNPIAGIEGGVAGTFTRAVCNITKANKKLGTIEVILDFEYISNFFKDQGVDLFVLIDKDKAFMHKPSKTDDLLPNHYIENLSVANLNVLPILSDFDMQESDFFRYKTHFFAVSPLIDANSKRIGHFVLHVNKNLKEQNALQEYLLLNSFF